MTLYEHMRTYCATSNRIASPKTAETYRAAVNAFRGYLGREPEVSDLTAENVAGMIAHRRQLGRSPNTIRGEVGKLLALWRWLSRQRLADWPMVELPHGTQSVPVAWSRSQLDSLWAAAYQYVGTIKGVPGECVLAALLSLLWDTGERIGAAYMLRWERIDWDSRWVVFIASERKGGIREHTARISSPTVRALKRLQSYVRSSPGPFLFADRSTLYYHYDRLLGKAGLPSDAKSKFQRIRRSHATHLHIAGGDATASLGHSSDSITRRHYLDSRLIVSRAAESLLFRPGRRLKTLWRVAWG